MKSEWILELLVYRDVPPENRWRKSTAYKYDPKEGIIPINTINLDWSDVEHLDYWRTHRMNYRLVHIPTGKIIPGDLL